MTTSIVSLGQQTADGILHDGSTLFAAALLLTDGTNPCKVILYDNTVASGKKVFEAEIPGAELSYLFDFSRPVNCKNGLYLDITGTGASCIVYTG